MEIEKKRFYPSEENVGKPCQFWNARRGIKGCGSTKFELAGTEQCKGTVSSECVSLKVYKPRPYTTPLVPLDKQVGLDICKP